MAFVIADRVKETATTTGTGSFSLLGAVSGFQSFDDDLNSADTCEYAIVGGAEWEVGLGTFTSPSTLARTTVIASSNADALVNFSAGTKDVFITASGPSILNSRRDNALGAHFLDISEISVPAVPAADAVRLFAQDDNGNTRLSYILADGIEVQIARDNIMVAKNTQGSAITEGQVVYVSGGVGASGTAEVQLARADSDNTSPCIGMVLETSIANNGFGRILLSGKVSGIDTSSFSEGAKLFLDATTAGAMTATAPAFPNFRQRVAVVINSHASAGSAIFLPGASRRIQQRVVGITVDGGGSALSTGTKGYSTRMPFNGTIVSWSLTADVTGSIVMDVWKDSAVRPDNTDSITASAKPTLTADDEAFSTTLTGWTTAVSVGDIFGFEIESVSTITQISLGLTIEVE